MAELTRDAVEHLARLARIDLDESELNRMVGELGVILESVATVQQAPTEALAELAARLEPLGDDAQAQVVAALTALTEAE